MSIWFISNYLYLIFPVYENLVHNYGAENCKIIILPGNMEDNYYNVDYLNKMNIDYIKLLLFRTKDYKRNLIQKFRLLHLSYKNYKYMYEYILEKKPSCVIVSSDLGNLNMRLLLGICMSLNIPINIYYPTDITFEKKQIIKYYDLLSSLIRFLNCFKLFIFIRALLFRGEIPGGYALGSQLYVISDSVRKKICDKGIPLNKVSVLGIFLNKKKKSREDFFKEYQLDNDKKLLVFFTECIQKIYGQDYAVDLYTNIKLVFDRLPTNISVIIKLHPREDVFIRDLINKLFIDNRYRIIHDFYTEDLLWNSDLSLAHYSRVLILAALMNKRFISINLKGDRKHTFLTSDESKILEISTYEQMESSIKKFILDEHYLEADQIIEEIAIKFRRNSLDLSSIKINS